MVTAILLGIIEGLTEFLPVSSTGHLILGANILGYTGDQARLFIIVIQIGAILAVVWEFRRKLWGFLQESWQKPLESNFSLKLLLAFLPTGVAGLLLHRTIERLFFNPTSVSWALILGGIAIMVIEKLPLSFQIGEAEDVTWRKALAIGFAQVCSLIPGISRSGATIMGGLLAGLNRKAATELSFFLAIPTMFAAGFYDLAKEWGNSASWDLSSIGTGLVTSFVAALLIIRPFTRYVQVHTFLVFACYRVLFGTVLLLWARFLT